MNSIVSKFMTDDNIKRKQSAGKAGGFVWSLVRIVIMIGLAYIILYPILFCLSISVRDAQDMLDPTVIWLPKTFSFENILFIFEKTDFWSAFGRTSGMSVLCATLQTLVCAITGYGFARFKFKGRNFLFILALLTFIVPPQIISMPLYIQYANFTEFTASIFGGEGIQFINTIYPITFSAMMGQGIKAGLFIYLFRQFYKGLPKELEDAAYLDGCGPAQAFSRIMLVNSSPIMLVSFLLSFVWYWNDYINVSLFFNKSKPLAVLLKGLEQAITSMVSADGVGYTELEKSVFSTTCCLLFIVVPIVVYTILQKKFTESLMSASIVG